MGDPSRDPAQCVLSTGDVGRRKTKPIDERLQREPVDALVVVPCDVMLFFIPENSSAFTASEDERQ